MEIYVASWWDKIFIVKSENQLMQECEKVLLDWLQEKHSLDRGYETLKLFPTKKKIQRNEDGKLVYLRMEIKYIAFQKNKKFIPYNGSASMTVRKFPIEIEQM